MRFYQAIVVSQMAAGSVFADHINPYWVHLLVEATNILIGGIAWIIGKALFGDDHK